MSFGTKFSINWKNFFLSLQHSAFLSLQHSASHTWLCIFNGKYMINWHKLIMIVICWRISTLHAIELKRIHFRAISICWRWCVFCQQADGIDVFLPVRRGYTLKAQRDLTTLSSQMHALRISNKHTKRARAGARAGVEKL